MTCPPDTASPRTVDSRCRFWLSIFNLELAVYRDTRQLQKGTVPNNFGDTRTEIQFYARFQDLMIHFELNNILVQRYAVDRCRRFLKKKKIMDSFRKEELLFSKLSLAAPAEYKTAFRRFYDTVCAEGDHPG